ncbi:hypothetical protein SDC9_94580 [bioreactor metagenome]|uniref:Uncharacterized protein n=1 Tax=bioreactor metagenome TaxID=1076179 RepID=A0A645A3U5_9ZZZZ
MIEHCLPDLGQPDLVQRRACQHWDAAVCVGGDELHRDGQLAGSDPGLAGVVAVGLVDGDHMGEFQDALLDALQLVTRAGEHQDQIGVDHPLDGDFGLAHADGLDNDDVVAGGFHEQHALAGGAGDTTEMQSGG